MSYLDQKRELEIEPYEAAAEEAGTSEVSDVQEKEVIYPIDKTTRRQKLGYSCLLKEAARREHAQKQIDNKDGKLSDEDFSSYKETYEVSMRAISKSISDRKQDSTLEDLNEVDLVNHITFDKINIPVEKDTWEKQLGWALDAREKMRRDHNEKGTAYRDGDWSNSQWVYFKDSFDAKSMVLSKKINDLKDNPPQADIDSIVIIDVVKDKIKMVEK